GPEADVAAAAEGEELAVLEDEPAAGRRRNLHAGGNPSPQIEWISASEQERPCVAVGLLPQGWDDFREGILLAGNACHKPAAADVAPGFQATEGANNFLRRRRR